MNPCAPRSCLLVVGLDAHCEYAAVLAGRTLGADCRVFASVAAFDAEAPELDKGCLVAQPRTPADVAALVRAVGAGPSAPTLILLMDGPVLSAACRAMCPPRTLVLPPDGSAHELVETIGGALRSRCVVPAPHAAFERIAKLEPRERQVLDLLVCGTPHKTIARRLGVSLRTTARLVASVLEKMGVDNAVSLARVVTALEPVAAGEG
jgi:DNA-binding NarL/FixJ family response regulator